LYGVVVCSKCRRAKGVRIGQKTTSCQCGHIIDLSVARIGSRTSSARELAKAVGLENAKLRGGRKEYEKAIDQPRSKRRVHDRVAEAAENAGNRDARVRAVAVELSRELDTFSARDFAVVLVSLGISNPQQCLEGLIEANFIYQPRTDRYKVV
jgi:hypothetical protein